MSMIEEEARPPAARAAFENTIRGHDAAAHAQPDARQDPIYVDLARQKNWHQAAGLALAATPAGTRDVLQRRGILTAPSERRRHIAANAANAFREEDFALSVAFDVLSADPANAEDMACIYVTLRGCVPFAGWRPLLLGWHRLTEGMLPDGADPDDPISMAWAAASACGVGELRGMPASVSLTPRWRPADQQGAGTVCDVCQRNRVGIGHA